VRGTAQGRAPLRAPALLELFDTTQLGLQRAIEGAAQRQTALASNLANANTPNFKPKDVDFHSALQAAFATGDRNAVSGAGFQTTTQTDVMRQDGNGIDVDVESAKMAQNGLEYQALVQVARGRIDILQSAMGTS
jgi:flagellar basal-body rod protein FlgB